MFTSTALLFIFEGYPVWPQDWESFLYLAVITVCGCIAQTTFNKGGQMIDATKTSVFRSTDVVFVLCWQIVLLHEVPTLWSFLGIFLICTSTVVMAITKSKRKGATHTEDGQLEAEISLTDFSELPKHHTEGDEIELVERYSTNQET